MKIILNKKGVNKKLILELFLQKYSKFGFSEHIFKFQKFLFRIHFQFCFLFFDFELLNFKFLNLE